MDIELNNKHVEQLSNEKEVSVKSKHQKSTTSKSREVAICNAYIKGTAFKTIAEEFNISAGRLYTILRKNDVPQRRESRTYEKVKYILNDEQRLQQFLKDYDKSSLEFVMWTHKLKRNQVYYILDRLNVDRKRNIVRTSSVNNSNGSKSASKHVN